MEGATGRAAGLTSAVVPPACGGVSLRGHRVFCEGKEAGCRGAQPTEHGVPPAIGSQQDTEAGGSCDGATGCVQTEQVQYEEDQE